MPRVLTGEEYERPAFRSDFDLKTVRWRWEEFVRLGFTATEASSMASRRDADLRKIEVWLTADDPEKRATHTQVMRIVAPLELADEPKELLALGAGTSTPIYEGPSPKV